jgi:hypothetical protein
LAQVLSIDRIENRVPAQESAIGAAAPARVDRSGGSGDDGGMDDGRIAAIESDVAVLKTDVAVLKVDVASLKIDVASLREEMRVGFAELRTIGAETKADIHKAIAENQRWTHGAVVGMFSLAVIGIIGLLVTIWNTSKTVAPISASSPPPIIINIPAQPSAAPALPGQK